MSEQLLPHNPTGTLPGICSTCYRLRSDEIHDMMPRGIHVVSREEVPIETSRIVPDIAIFNDPDVSKFKVLQIDPNDETPEIPADYLQSDATVDAVASSDGLNGIVRHDPTCKCAECVSQLAAEVHRPAHVLDIMQQGRGRHLTGRESCDALETHKDFVIVNLIKDKDGNDYPDWSDKLNAHIQDIRRKIELFRVHEQATMHVRASKETEEMAKLAETLSPEEIAAYKANTSKTARGAKPKAVPKEKDPSKQLAELTKKRDAAHDALKAMNWDKAAIDAQLKTVNEQIEALRAAVAKPAVQAPVAAAPEERMSKRERQIASLIKAGLTKDVAERMVPNA